MATTSSAIQQIQDERRRRKQEKKNKKNRVWLIPEPSVILNHHSSSIIHHYVTTSHYHHKSSIITSPTMELNVEIQLNDFDATSDKLIRDLRQAIHQTLKFSNRQLNHGTIDLLMIQLPSQVYENVDRLIAVWSELERMVKMETVKHVGLCYVDEEQLEQLLQCIIIPSSSVSSSSSDHQQNNHLMHRLPFAIQLNFWEYNNPTNHSKKQSGKWQSMNALCNRYGIKVLAASGNSVASGAEDKILLKKELLNAVHIEQQRWLSHYTVQLPETSLIQTSGYIISDQMC